MSNGNFARQGDVGMAKLSKLPNGLKPHTLEEPHRFIIAHGEVTGHAHAVYDLKDIELFEDSDGTLYMRNNTEKTVKHEEHDPITLPAGNWKFIQQREYHREEIRNVID